MGIVEVSFIRRIRSSGLISAKTARIAGATVTAPTRNRNPPMRVEILGGPVEFRPWRPGDGAVFDSTFTFDCETTRLDVSIDTGIR